MRLKAYGNDYIFLRYLLAIVFVALALGLRMLLIPWTGVGAPFLVFFLSVLTSNILLGPGPGLLAGLLATPIAAYFFVYQAHYTVSQARAQGILFFVEISIVCLWATYLKRTKKSAEVDRLRARKALEERRISEVMAENTSDFVAILNAEGRPNYINPAGRRLIGLRPDFPVESMALKDLYPPDEWEFMENVVLKTVQEQGVWQGETRLRNYQTWEVVPVSVCHFLICDRSQERVLGMALVIRDISQLKKVEAALRSSEFELKEAQRVAHVGNLVRNVKSGTASWSDELFRIFGRDPQRGVPSRGELLEFFTPESRIRLSSAIEKTLSEGIPFVLELELIRPNGSRRWVFVHGEAFRDSSGEIAGYRGAAQDITERKQLQMQREEWTSVIAHDLRQPIAVILMNAALLQKFVELGTDEKGRVACANISTAASDLSRMVDDLLDSSRMEAHRLSLNQKWIDPALTVQSAVKRLSHLTEKFSVTIVAGEKLLPVYADAARIEQVLGNLISNAAKYGKPGSEIRIELKQEERRVVISVTNHGRGIPPSEFKSLFSRFTRSEATRHSNVPGLGLGLYISRGLVEAHGGEIWVNSIPGDTTTFYFTLPTAVLSVEKIA